MKKKVFSLMMTLVLAFVGIARASELTVNDGTATNGYVPVYGFYADAYLKAEFVMPAADLAEMNGATINGMTFYASQTSVSWGAASFQVFLTEVGSTSISAFNGPGTVVYEGALSIVDGQMVVNFTTPYQYNGGNLLIGVYNTALGDYVTSTWYGVDATGASVQGYSYTSLASITASQRNFLPKTTFSYSGGGGGGGGGTSDVLMLSYNGDEVDNLHLGALPGYVDANVSPNWQGPAWMEPKTVYLVNDNDTDYEISVLDFTPSDGLFIVETWDGEPFTIAAHDSVALGIKLYATPAVTGTLLERQFVAIYNGTRTAMVWPISADVYSPYCPDIFELALNVDPITTGWPFVNVPLVTLMDSDVDGLLHNDYTLPFPEIPEGYDAVYKLEFENDVVLNAAVTNGANGKVALYREDFNGEGGPMAHNYYTGPQAGEGGGGGASGAPFEALIGDPTSTNTTGYNPMYYLYNYSLSTAIYTAAELTEAGATSAPMTSVSWFSESTWGYNIQNVSIWMANVADTEVSTTSPLGSGMTLVYQGNHQEVIGENEFVFNAGSFAWDGTSNVIVMVQMNNGSWSSSISWQSTNPGFTAMSYDYTDNAPYDAQTTSYSMYTSSTSRGNILFKANGRSAANRDSFAYGFEGTLQGWTTVAGAENEGVNWLYSDDNPGYYDYSQLAHTGTGFAMSYSYVDYDGPYLADNYFVSPQKYDLGAGSTLDFWYDYGNDTYPDYFEVCVSTATTPTAASFTSVWDNYSRSNAAKSQVRHNDHRYQNWRNVSVDLSAYAGQNVWVAFHHYDYDMYEVWIDDVTITTGGTTPTPPTPPTPLVDMAYGPVIENAAVAAGRYYLVASSTDMDFEVTINAEDMPCPLVEGFAFGPTPADNEDEVEPASVTLRWNIPDYATGWRLIFGSTYYPDPNHPQTVMYPEDGSFTTELANSYTVRNLWNNTNYFWRVEFNNTNCPDGVSSPIWGFTTHLNVPTNLRADDETIFEDETLVLRWNSIADRTFRTYRIYQDGELIGNTTITPNPDSYLSYQVSGLDYNMAGYMFQVSAVYDEGESALSDPVMVKVSGYGDISGYVYEQDGDQPVPGATVTYNGFDEFNDPQSYSFTTNAYGYYIGTVKAGEYYGQASKEGYQTATSPLLPFTNPVSVFNDIETTPVNYILDENFDPVCGVIAEYYPDSLDPYSPYVKVYWGCGLPGSDIIEDFETGDFSMFDWQLDPTYPWAITSNNPYEGEYCMKSTNEGIDGSTSTMQVTVDIPRNGQMSFFGKISSEQGWDFGYFYIDNVQMGSYSGVGSWGERTFDITAGEHTFMWSFYKDDICCASGDDCFYVDYIRFISDPEPVGAGWHTFLEGEFNDALRSNLTDHPSFGYHYPAGLTQQYNGFLLTKVSMFSDDLYGAVGGTYTCTVYRGGSTPGAGTAVSTLQVNLPVGLGQWVDWDLTTPVNVVGGEDLWVIYTVDAAGGMGYPAGMCNTDSNPNGDWWNAGEGWENYGGGVWTMRNYFTDRGGRSVVLGTSNNASVAVNAPTINSNLRTYAKGVDYSAEVSTLNPNHEVVATRSNNTRALSHYRVYRTNCYNDGPYTEENTVLLATVWVPDTVYIDVEWADLEPGIYKWGVGTVYSGNRGEEIAGPITWTAPQAVNMNRSFSTSDNDPNPVQGEVNGNRAPWDLMLTFNAPEAAHYGVVSDGQYIYTSNWGYSSAAHNFYKYDMQGNMIEGFEIAGCGTLRGMTFDGQYVYGVANANTVYCVDLNNHTLISSFTTTYGAMRGITYDPQRDGFWVIGNWSGNLTLIDRTGAIVTVGPEPTSASDLAYYKDENNVEHVYCFNNSDNGVYDYNITTNTLGGSVFDFSLVPGFNAGTSGGCHVGEYNGKVAFFGDIQQDPNLIGIYELRDSGVTPGPTPGYNSNYLALPRESETIWSNCLDKDMWLIDGLTVTVLLNSADNPEGATVNFRNYNDAEEMNYPMPGVELDSTGYYVYDMFRRGTYEVTVEKDGYYDIYDSVNIWNPTDLRYVMTEILFPVDGLYVSSTGWAMWGEMSGGGTTPTGGDNSFAFSFEDGFEGWTTIDNDGNGLNWVNSINSLNASGYDYSGLAHTGNYFVYSQSYIDYDGAYTADNYLVSPQKYAITSGSTLNFWADNANDSYPDHFAVAIATVDDPTAADFTDIWSHTGAKGGNKAAVRHNDDPRYENWRSHSVDLSAYAGQNVWIAFHHQDYDMYEIWIDDVELNPGRTEDERHLEFFKVMCTSLDGEPIFNANTPVEQPFCQLATDALVPGEHYICQVAAVYSTGTSAWTACEWQYIPCEIYAPSVNGIEVEGNTYTWEYPGGEPGPDPDPEPGDDVTVILTAGDVWGDGSGYQMLLDADANAYGTTIPETGALSLNCSGNEAIYAEFEYKIPANADGNCSTQNMVMNNSVSITIPAGTYDWCITNPTPGDRIWIASANGNVGGRQDDYTFVAGNTYEFTVSMGGSNDQVNVVITGGAKSGKAPLACGEVKDIADVTPGNYGYIVRPANTEMNRDYLQYCTEAFSGGVGTGGGAVYWGVRFPAADLAPYAGQTLTKVGNFMDIDGDYGWTYSGNYTVRVYVGGATAPGTLVSEATEFLPGDMDWHDITLTTPVTIDATLDLWLTFYTPNIAYPMSGCDYVGNNNSDFLSLDGVTWEHSTDYALNYTWMIRGLVENSGPTPQPGESNCLGAMVFADGEWEAFVPYPTNEYTYDGFAEELCFRMVYDGPANLPEGNIYFSMSCPECVETVPGCAFNELIHGDYVYNNDYDFGALIWWGEQIPPIEPIEDWLYYDDGVYATSVGAGSTLYWGTMIPSGLLAPYAGTSLTKVALCTSYAGSTTVNVYLGGANAPQTLVSSQSFNMVGDNDFMEVSLNTIVPIDGTQNLWITFYNTGVQYPADACNDTGDANNRWVSVDGNQWMDLATAGLPGYGWMIRGFVTNQAKGGEVVALPEFKGNVGGELGHTAVVSIPTDLSFMNNSRSEIVAYNVYRATEADGPYDLIAVVPAVAGETYYEWFDDEVLPGTYFYQVTAVYDNGCESEPAPAFDDPTDDFVGVFVTGIGENTANVNLYPNPTSGNVKIEATGMRHITVVSVIGQTVYDADVKGDELELNMAQFNAGVYVVRIVTESGISTQRVTVVR